MKSFPFLTNLPLSLVFLVSTVFGISSFAADFAAPAIPPQTKDVAQLGQTYQVVEFQLGQSTLTNNAKLALRSFVDAARASGTVDRIHVAVWSDKPCARDAQDLPDADQELASLRIDSIQRFLEDQLKQTKVKTYNMAEYENWFSRAVTTDDSELKSVFAQHGAPKSVNEQQLHLVKQKGGPRKAVLLVEMASPNASKESGPVFY